MYKHDRARREGPFSIASKIERNVTLGLAAADQQIAIGRRLDWVRPVDDGAEDEPSLASAADPGPACPPDGHIARLGKVEEALEGRSPADVQAAPREGHQWAPAGRPGRL